MAPPRRLLFSGVALTTAGLIGWGLAAVFPPQTSALGSRSVVNQEIQTLLAHQQQGDLSSRQRFELVERLIAIRRFDQALEVLASWREDTPDTVELTLLIADLRRRSGDHLGAEHDLNQLLRLHPNQLDAVKLKALVLQDSGRGREAIQQVQQRFKQANGPQQRDLGLLLADLQRLNGDRPGARKLYRDLAARMPRDAGPVLALALLEQEDGNTAGVQALLAEARLRRSDNQPDPLIDQLAGRWGLEAARVRAVQPAAADTP
ncbi:MAG: tetratricopeptide repeat protein [Synechococcus sp.]